jgi:hypothetical protein
MWVSEDGASWREVAGLPNDAAFQWTDIAASGPRVVAIGAEGDQVAVLESPDAGLSWVRASPGLLSGPRLASVAGSSLGFMAVGRTAAGMAPVAIGSTDGVQWVELPAAAGLS